MEVHMKGIGFSVTHHQLTSYIAEILHGPDYARFSSLPVNFHVHLFRDKKGLHRHSGSGSLTLPTDAIGVKFLSEYGGPYPPKRCLVEIGRIVFSKSFKKARPDVVENINRLPFLDPKAVEEKERLIREFQTSPVAIRSIQFGRECRDSIFSIEWEHSWDEGCRLSFDNERRELRVKVRRLDHTSLVAIRFFQIDWMSANNYLSEQPIIFFSLQSPPMFELEQDDTKALRQRLTALDFSDHARVAPYASLALRLVCQSNADLTLFKDLVHKAQLHNLTDFEYPVERRGLYSLEVLTYFEDWLRTLNWCVAFQVEAVVRNFAVDPAEMLSLKADISRLTKSKGKQYVAMMLRHFSAQAQKLYWSSYDSEEWKETISECFRRSEKEYELQSRSAPLKPTDGSLFDCLHATITPTGIFLDGPFPERSNRVIRTYHQNHQESFLRVAFVDEGRLQYRFDREVDGPKFINLRVGPILKEGLRLAGKEFKFLAYSQSSLKEHAVWFVKPFRDPVHGYVDAPTIIKSLGSFDRLEWDPKLIYCPARYAARLSQAFTATDASITVEVEEIIHLPDIKAGQYCHTDGVGTISREMAQDIWGELRKTRRRARRAKARPSSFQVRFMGSKGMLSVDHALKGRAICIRPSMIKFEAPESREIEIARAFDRPGNYYLNRPLIMILEGLGVPYEVFKHYQDKVVQDVNDSTESLSRAASMLEAYGLGSSFRLTSVMLSLDRLGVDLDGDPFYRRFMEFSVFHVLRELKQRARIPIPGAWTLVGVADVHKQLREGEIFACIKPVNSSAVIYLEGPTVISRSPTIHPGDVQIANAIGRPPPGSSFDKEPLANTVVFSTEGVRPLPSCLGGGDLDGDEYNLIPLNEVPEFTFKRTCAPGSYDPAPRRTLDRPSTMNDVADFIMEHINSDVLGIVAINWLIIADQSPQGIFDQDCTTLSQLHSDAVDYPKSGQPVALRKIPKLHFRAKPDWNAPETINADSAAYYQSQRAIGKLFRAIELPVLEMPRNSRMRRRQGAPTVDALNNAFNDLHTGDDSDLEDAIEESVGRYISTTAIRSRAKLDYVAQIFSRYTSELQNICVTYTLSHAKSSFLTEEEAIVGTIVARSSQQRKRKDNMSKMREQTDILVRGIREELAGDDETTLEECLERAWLAWRLSIARQRAFGAKSFGWVALGAIFEASKEIEDERREGSRFSNRRR